MTQRDFALASVRAARGVQAFVRPVLTAYDPVRQKRREIAAWNEAVDERRRDKLEKRKRQKAARRSSK